MLAGEYAAAVSIYREMVKELPENAGLRLNLAVALEKAGQPSAAIPELERITKSAPPAWFLLGLAYQQLNQPAKAIAPLRNAVRLDPKNMAALLELADAELTTGDARGAVRDFGALAAAEPDSPKAREGLGRAYVSLSEQAYKQLETGAPDSAYRVALLARSRASEGRYGEALRLYATALAGGAIPGLHEARALIYRETKHEEWAAIEEGRERGVPKPDCAKDVAACAYLAADWQRAIGAGAARSTESLYWTALASERLADEEFRKLAQFPESAEMHAVVADSYQRMGRRLEAVAEWRKAVGAQPQDRMLRGRLGESLFLAREYPEAEEILSQLVKEQPENGEWQYLLGNLLLQTNRDEEALGHLTIATRMSPGRLPAQEALGRVYVDLGKPEAAVSHLEKALPIDNGSISFALSTVYRKLGRTEEAKKALARYQALSKYDSADGGGKDSAIPAP